MFSFDFIAVLLIVLVAFFFVAYRVIGLLSRRNPPSCCTPAEPLKKEAADGQEITEPVSAPSFSLGSCAGCAFSMHCGVPSSSARKPKGSGGPEGKN